jgi:hypothetical protein
LADRRPAAKERQDGKRRLLGEQFRSAAHDEDKPDGLHIRDEEPDDRFGKNILLLSHDDGHQDDAEADVQARRQARYEQSADRPMQSVHAFLDLDSQDFAGGHFEGAAACGGRAVRRTAVLIADRRSWGHNRLLRAHVVSSNPDVARRVL